VTAPLPREPELDRALRDLRPVLSRFALRATGNVDLAQDLVQDALVAAMSATTPFAGRSSLRTWVLGILSHKVMDHFRAQRRPEAGADDPELLQTASEADLERATMAKQTLRRVEEALATLPERERLVVLLVDVEGVDREAACHALDVSATHLRVLLHRGRNRLRRSVEHD
jgi:RNA polymerase sigma-70 factor (ECF subfamily)